MEKQKIIYGYTPNIEIFKGKTVKEQVKILKDMGITGVFGGFKDKEFVKAMHEEGLKIYISFGCFKGKEVWEEYPQARPVEQDGKLLEPDGNYYGVNPAYEPYREKQLAEFKKLIEEYEVDGIWLDFIRWPCHWEVENTYLPKTSFDELTLKLFERECKIELKGETIDKISTEISNNYEQQWIKWRCNKITYWVEEARKILDHSGKNITLGMFSVPWINEEKDNAIIKIIGQDFNALSQYIDIISPMVYHKMCGKPVKWIGDVTNWMKANCSAKIIPIIQSVDVPSQLENEEYEESVNEALNIEDSNGIMIFKLEGITSNPKRMEITTRLLFKSKGVIK